MQIRFDFLSELNYSSIVQEVDRVSERVLLFSPTRINMVPRSLILTLAILPAFVVPARLKVQGIEGLKTSWIL